MSRACPAQMKKLLDILSEGGILKNGKVIYTNTNKQNFWKRIAIQLNAVEGGVYKNTWKWCKTWADWKNKTKRKANMLFSKKSNNEELPPPSLTNLELRLLKIINYNFEDKQIQVDMFDKLEEETTEKIERLTYYNEAYNDVHKSEPFFDENNHNQKTCCYVNDILSEKKETAECSSLVDRKEKVKLNGRSLKRKKMTLEEYQIRTKFELERERLQHRTEELRLKAVELKLKGDELKLKESEMNKINYLTTLEEEKLKCFKEISMSLKELLERSRSGNLRFSNSFE